MVLGQMHMGTMNDNPLSDEDGEDEEGQDKDRINEDNKDTWDDQCLIIDKFYVDIICSFLSSIEMWFDIVLVNFMLIDN